MKKIILSLSATALLSMAIVSCNNEEKNKEAQAADDAKVTSAVEAKKAEYRTQLETECANSVNAKAQAIVDSISAMPKAKQVAAVAAVKKAVVKAKANPKPVVPAPKVNPSLTDKKNKISGNTQKEVTKEQTQEKQNKISGNSEPIKVTEEQTNKKKSKIAGGN